MSVVFFVSSVGDTDLAKETIIKMKQLKFNQKIYLVPLTNTASERIANLSGDEYVIQKSLNDIIALTRNVTDKQIQSESLDAINLFIKEHDIQRAYIGVPSDIEDEVPFQIGQSIKIPSTIVYEYMFKPNSHRLWQYVNNLSARPECDFAVPFHLATEDIREINSVAKVHEIGHLSIDRVMNPASIDISPIKKNLLIETNDELAFIAGTTQPTNVDKTFLEALLSELATGQYPHLQIRFGLHPGVKDLDSYLATLLEVCQKYPSTQTQFKIVLTKQLEQRIKNLDLTENIHILKCEVSGAMASAAADKIAQAVPGALLNESVFKKPCYAHDQAKTYLPKKWFSADISTFFNARSQKARSPIKNLDWKEPASMQMAHLMLRN